MRGTDAAGKYENIRYGVKITGNLVEAFTNMYTVKPDGAASDKRLLDKKHPIQSREQTRKVLDMVVESNYLKNYNNKDNHNGKTK